MEPNTSKSTRTSSSFQVSERPSCCGDNLIHRAGQSGLNQGQPNVMSLPHQIRISALEKLDQPRPNDHLFPGSAFTFKPHKKATSLQGYTSTLGRFLCNTIYWHLVPFGWSTKPFTLQPAPLFPPNPPRASFSLSTVEQLTQRTNSPTFQSHGGLPLLQDGRRIEAAEASWSLL